jgi:hypothetical protein
MSPLGLKLTLNYVRILGDVQGEVSLGLVFFFRGKSGQNVNLITHRSSDEVKTE